MEPKELFEFLVEYFRQDPKEVLAVEAKLTGISEDYYVKYIKHSPLTGADDFRGIPALIDDTVTWFSPDKLPQEGLEKSLRKKKF